MSDVGRTDAAALHEELRVLSQVDLTKLLCLTALNMTIVGRETYVPGTVEISNGAKLRAVNECQHFLLGIQAELLLGGPVDMEALSNSMVLLLESDHIGSGLRRSLSTAWRRVRAGSERV